MLFDPRNLGSRQCRRCRPAAGVRTPNIGTSATCPDDGDSRMPVLANVVSAKFGKGWRRRGEGSEDRTWQDGQPNRSCTALPPRSQLMGGTLWA
jgi:hypothetical protein